MDLICNADMVVKIFDLKSTMQVRSNGGNMKVTHQAILQGYYKLVWFSKQAITNIIALLEYLHHHVRVAEQIHGGLVIEENHFA